MKLDSMKYNPEETGEMEAKKPLKECPNCGLPITSPVAKCPKCAEFFLEEALELDLKKTQVPTAFEKHIIPLLPDTPTPIPVPVEEKYTSAKPIASSNREEALYLKSIQETSRRLRNEQDTIIPLLRSEIRAKLFFISSLVLMCLILACASFYIAFQMSFTAGQRINDKIAEKFSENKIQSTFSQVVEHKAEVYISKDLREASEIVKNETKKFQDYLSESKSIIHDEYQHLVEGRYARGREKEIFELADQALQGMKSAYDLLIEYSQTEASKELAELSLAQAQRVESLFGLINRIGDVSVNSVDAEGKGLINQEVSTAVLLQEMKTSPHWKIRAKAADLLGNRKEKGVAGELLQSAQLDPYLDVTQYALLSFSKVTGYEGKGLFNVRDALNWWKENNV